MLPKPDSLLDHLLGRAFGKAGLNDERFAIRRCLGEGHAEFRSAQLILAVEKEVG